MASTTKPDSEISQLVSKALAIRNATFYFHSAEQYRAAGDIRNALSQTNEGLRAVSGISVYLAIEDRLSHLQDVLKLALAGTRI